MSSLPVSRPSRPSVLPRLRLRRPRLRRKMCPCVLLPRRGCQSRLSLSQAPRPQVSSSWHGGSATMFARRARPRRPLRHRRVASTMVMTSAPALRRRAAPRPSRRRTRKSRRAGGGPARARHRGVSALTPPAAVDTAANRIQGRRALLHRVVGRSDRAPPGAEAMEGIRIQGRRAPLHRLVGLSGMSARTPPAAGMETMEDSGTRGRCAPLRYLRGESDRAPQRAEDLVAM